MSDATSRGRFGVTGGRPWFAEVLATPAAQELGSTLVHHAAELVELATDLDEEGRLALVAAVLDSLLALRNGSTRVPVNDAVLALLEAGSASAILGSGEDFYGPLVVVDGWLYHQRTLHYERSLARAVRARQDVTESLFSTEEIAATADRLFGDSGGFRLSEEQRAAVLASAGLPLSVVTGGPGTGKTSIVVALLRLLVELGVDPHRIALGAPTGKAANRLGESIWEQLEPLGDESAQALTVALEANPPATLHRLLRYMGDRAAFGRDESDPIPADWVIVDEASMIDLVLMERLVRCVRPNAHLVLLGDVQQLPSVDTGTVLRDLVTSDRHVCRLQQSFRMDPSDPRGRAILRFAEAVREGEPVLARERIAEAPAVAMKVVEPHTYRPELLSFVEDWFDNRITALEGFWGLIGRAYPMSDGSFDDDALSDIRRLFEHYGRFRILCLTRVFAGGTNALNEAFHARLARRTSPAESAAPLIAGEPVLMLRNDYDRGLFNGDHGLVLRVDTGDDVRLAAVFDEGGTYRAHHLSGLGGQLAHAWAMTVHKSQGSEFDDVAVVLPEEDIPLLSRELLYTAVTRARHSVSLFGFEELLDVGIQRVIERYSGLGEAIAAPA